jgi:hypothetical protein
MENQPRPFLYLSSDAASWLTEGIQMSGTNF